MRRTNQNYSITYSTSRSRGRQLPWRVHQYYVKLTLFCELLRNRLVFNNNNNIIIIVITMSKKVATHIPIEGQNIGLDWYAPFRCFEFFPSDLWKQANFKIIYS